MGRLPFQFIGIAMSAGVAATDRAAGKPLTFLDANGVPTLRNAIPLVLLGFGLLVTIPLSCVALAGTFYLAATGEASDGNETWALAEGYRDMLWVTGGLRTLYLAAMIVAAYFFFNRRSRALRMLIAIFACGIAFNLLEAIWAWKLAEGKFEYAADEIIGVIPASVMGVVWILYFWLSKKVKRIFVYPLGGAKPQAAGELRVEA